LREFWGGFADVLEAKPTKSATCWRQVSFKSLDLNFAGPTN
jgi:hypothetical protein